MGEELGIDSSVMGREDRQIGLESVYEDWLCLTDEIPELSARAPGGVSWLLTC